MFIVTPGNDITIEQNLNPTPIILNGAQVSNGATTGAWSILTGSGILSDTSQTDSPSLITFTPDPTYTGTVILLLTTNSPGSVSAIRRIIINPLPPVYPQDVSTIALYHAKLLADQPFMNSVISAINLQIQINTDEDLGYQFDIDLTPQIGNCPILQQQRIINETIQYYRNIGIQINTSPLWVPSTIQFAQDVSLVLHIYWWIRNSQEYLKTYC